MEFVLLAAFVTFWVAIAWIAIRTKRSKTIAIGGGFIGACIGLTIVAYGYGFATGRFKLPDSSQAVSAVPTTPSLPSPHDVLDRAALNMLMDGRVGWVNVCDKIYDQSLDHKVYGTIAAGAARLPAIKAHYNFMCVNPANGAREQKTELWVVLALDELSGVDRCVKLANDRVVKEVADGCDFRLE